MGILPTMAFVVRRRTGQWEIRESVTTPSGPRSRTLVTFGVLTGDVLARAEEAATRPIDPARLRRSAWRSGARVAEPEVDRLSRQLVHRMARGDRPNPALSALLSEGLGGRDRIRSDDLALWVGASPEERGEALVDLLSLSDALPPRPREPLRFPRLSTRGAGGG